MEMSGHLTPGGRDPQYSLNTSLHGPQSWSGNFGEENKVLSLLGKTHNSPAQRPVTTPAMLHRLLPVCSF